MQGYETPFSIRYEPLCWWMALTIWLCFWLVVSAGTWQGYLAAVVVTAVALTYWLFRYKHVSWDRVRAVSWDDRMLVLATERGTPSVVEWQDITKAVLPPDPGYKGYDAAVWFRARLFVHGRDSAFKVPLSFTAECKEFLEAIRARAAEVETVDTSDDDW